MTRTVFLMDTSSLLSVTLQTSVVNLLKASHWSQFNSDRGNAEATMTVYLRRQQVPSMRWVLTVERLQAISPFIQPISPLTGAVSNWNNNGEGEQTPSLLGRYGLLPTKAVPPKIANSLLNGVIATTHQVWWRMKREELQERTRKSNPSSTYSPAICR